MLDGRRTLPSFFLFAMVECDVIGCGKGPLMGASPRAAQKSKINGRGSVKSYVMFVYVIARTMHTYQYCSSIYAYIVDRNNITRTYIRASYIETMKH